MTTLRCDIHNIDKECTAGSSAHYDNWYCPVCESERGLFEVWNKHQPFSIEHWSTWLFARAPLLAEIERLKEELEGCRDVIGEYR